MNSAPGVEAVRMLAEEAGLALRGGFLLSEEDRVGPLAQTQSLLLLGFMGAQQWPAFEASRESSDGLKHPLDRWSRRVMTALASRLGAMALFPFEGPPYWPFQVWAQRAEPVFPSPIGMLVHPEYGLSHSYRGALAFREVLALPARPSTTSPCASCEAKPCLTACPVGAFTGAGYNLDACAGFLRASGADCLTAGCLARRACPVGRAHSQAPAQARFHMAAFLAARD